MKKFLSLFALVVLFFSSKAQVAPNKYWVQFTDKNNSPYSIDRPQEFLSQRAIDRREKFNIQIDELDIPVNQAYIDAVAGCGAEILNPSKWLNGVTIKATDTLIINMINELEFVEEIRGCFDDPLRQEIKDKYYFEDESLKESGNDLDARSVSGDSSYYGYAYTQINQLNGVALHQQGFTGQGVLIGICDGGFAGADYISLFDAVRNEGRLLGTRDFANGGTDVFTNSTHGTAVFGLMGGKVEGTYVGTAPDAMFFLCRTEETRSENVIEEYHWVSGVELLDSIGADIMNSSLGYITFDDPLMDHTYDQMDGQTCVISRGAEIACSRGILVVNSAGNEGSQYNEWRWIGAPADAEHVFTIGAVDAFGERAGFSSIGPTYDGRVKPDVMAHGQNVYVSTGEENDFRQGNGTSYSSPVTCGMTACLMQAMPDKNPQDIRDCIRKASSNAENPDYFYGFGIPDYMAALNFLGEKELSDDAISIIKIYPNPSNGVIFVDFDADGEKSVQIYNQLGVMIYNIDNQNDNNELQTFLSDLSSGIYFVKINDGEKKYSTKVIKY